MKEVFIVSMARTPIGNLGGALSSLSVIDLGKTAVEGALNRANLEGTSIDEVFMGCVLTANTGQAPAKQVALAAGVSNTTPCTTINKVCSSGMKAVMLGAQSILLGDNDVVLVGGMESMSNAPHMLPSMRNGVRYGNNQVVDAIVRDGLQDPYNGDMMGVCGEVCAEGKNISKKEQDAYAFASYERARAAFENGVLAGEIVPVSVPQRRKDPIIVSVDEEVQNKRITDLASVEKGRAVFKKEGTVSAINASKINDGAAAMVLMSGEKVKELGLKPLAKVLSYADAAQEPVWFTTAPALAMPKAAQKANMKVEEFDLYEINEAFSVVALANMKELNIAHDQVNVLGGAVSMGHPIGVSGCRIIMTLVSALQHKGGKTGLAGICNGGGGASAMLIEAL